MATQDTIVINEGFEERQRTTSSGTKSRFTFSIKSEPIFHNFDPIALGAKPAAAIRDAISAGIRAIAAAASPATLLKRKYARAALERGAKWAVTRYAGGRTGVTAPGGGDALFNDSGRLAGGIFVRQNPAEKSWTVNVPANRLDPSTFADRGAFVAMVDRLRALVPAIANPFSIPAVITAIESTLNEVLVRKLGATYANEGELAGKIADTIGDAVKTADDNLSE